MRGHIYGSAALSFVFLTSGASAPVPGPFDYDTVEIAPNVYGFFEKRLNPIVSSNIIAVIGQDAVLVFDTGHWHDDRFAGNAGCRSVMRWSIAASTGESTNR